MSPPIFDGHDTALLYFARSLAVVLEEAVRRIGGEEQTNQSPNVETPSPSAVAEVAAVAGKPIQTMMAATTTPAVSGASCGRNTIEAPSPIAAAATTSAIQPTTVQSKTGGAPVGKYAQRTSNDPQLDYSPEAIAGRINIWSISDTVKREQLMNLLIPIDLSFELIYPQTKGKPRGYANVKFKSNEKANEAVRRLNRTSLNGELVNVKRALFWFKNPRPLYKSIPPVNTAHCDGHVLVEQIIDGNTVCTDTVDEHAQYSASLDSDDVVD